MTAMRQTLDKVMGVPVPAAPPISSPPTPATPANTGLAQPVAGTNATGRPTGSGEGGGLLGSAPGKTLLGA